MPNALAATLRLTSTAMLLAAALQGCVVGETDSEALEMSDVAADDAADDCDGDSDDGTVQCDSNEETAEANQSIISSPVSLNLFKTTNPWTKDVSLMTKASKSDAIITWLSNAGGWGGGTMKIDFGLTVMEADSTTPKKTFTATDEFYSPDCDKVAMPMPAGGSLEGESGYSCTMDGDCHLIVHHKTENKLYEMWRANMSGGTFYGGCTAVWDLNKLYPANLRGEGCTSADAAGFPIAPLLFTPAEVKAGAINHAIRFILPNSRIRDNYYVRPATHQTSATTGGVDAPPYGVHFRLRKDYPLANLPSNGARTIAKALQKYGMYLSDGGTIALTGASDKYSSVKWTDVGVNSMSLSLLKVKDFEVVDMGTPINWSGDCYRNP